MLRCPRTHSGRASTRLGRSVCTVTTVGAHRRRLHGRPRTGHASSVFRLDVRPELGSWGASTIMLMAWRSSAAVCPCPLETPGSMASAAPSRLAAVPRRTGPRRPVTGAAAIRTASGGTGPRAATLAPTSPAHVPAGQRANIPGIYLCLRGGPGPGWAARRGARLVAGPFPRGLPPEPRWRLSTHVALWDLRRAVGGCPWIASWQARQTIRVLRRICVSSSLPRRAVRARAWRNSATIAIVQHPLSRRMTRSAARCGEFIGSWSATPRLPGRTF
jgi:hypothetical protein